MSNSHSTQTKWILLSMILGLIFGLLIYFFKWEFLLPFIKPLGSIFISCLKMMIIPLVFSSIFMAIVNLGSPEELGSLGLKAVIYYTLTTCFAAFIGLVLVNLFQPGSGLDISQLAGNLPDHVVGKVQAGADTGLFKTVLGVFMDAIPSNPFKAMADTKILQIITFSILFGMVALFYRKDSEPMIQVIASLEKMSMALVNGIMYLAPLGIFSLLSVVIAEAGLDALKALGIFVVTVLTGLLVHFIFLLLLASWRSRKSPIFILKACLPPLLTAFSTASSAATLPVTMTTVEEDLGVDKKTAQFILPLGATINMDGTAIYESVAVIFIGQAYGLDLGLSNQILIFFTASLAAVGAAAIPGAGLVTMGIVLTAVGFPLEGVGLIYATDRILDMFRTAVNVFGDCVGTVVVESIGKKG